MSKKQSVVIVGGGWAGLTAAVSLVEAGYRPLVLEAARQLGGRARCVPFAGMPVDNGQHLFIGAYQAMLDILDKIGCKTEDCFMRQPLSLTSYYPDGSKVRLVTKRLPAPLHLLSGLLSAGGLSLQDRWHAILFGSKLYMGLIRLNEDISLQQLLREQKQAQNLVNAFWEPLCLAIMNTPLKDASALLFIQVLQGAFFHHQSDSDLLFARRDLGSLFADPAMDYIEKHGGTVRLSCRVDRLEIDAGVIKGVHVGDDLIEADQIIVATPPHATQKLLTAQDDLHSLQTQLQRFSYQPIVTVYLQYAPHVQLPEPMLGMLNTTSQWVFDRGIYNQNGDQAVDQHGLMAVVISSSGPHMEMKAEQLAEQVSRELATLFPHWPAPQDSFVVREKRATFSSHRGVNQYRPGNTTPVSGLWLAGDYTYPAYPATLEAAVQSGLQCARLVHEARSQSGSRIGSRAGSQGEPRTAQD